MSSSTKLLSTQEYAQAVGVSPSTISKWLRQGKIKGQKENGKWVIPADQNQMELKTTTGEKKSVPAKPVQTKNKQFYTVEKFSAMTYLTSFGVIQWLKERRLIGIKDDSGQWQVSAENLQNSRVQRLLRN